MQLSVCLQQFSEILQQEHNYVLLFQGIEYPPLFFSYFVQQYLTDNSDYMYQQIDTANLSEAQIQSQLVTTFLGQKCIYWFGNCSSLKPKQKEFWIKYFSEYTGPHKIIAFFDDKIKINEKHVNLIEIKKQYTFDDVKSLFAQIADVSPAKMAFFLSKIYRIKKSFSLDELFLLKDYVGVMGAKSEDFYKLWLNRLVVADESLYTLSQLFFEKKKHQFFDLWFQMKESYSEMFWVSFWSEQLYKAYFFIVFTKAKKFTEAKKVSFGLPFQFMKQTYAQCRLKDLSFLHQKIYQVDLDLKTGGSSYSLDKFLLDVFAKSL